MTAPDASTVDPDRPRAGTPAAPSVLAAGVPWYRRPPELPRVVAGLSAERARAESELDQRYRARVTAADAMFRDQTARIEAVRTTAKAQALAAYDAAHAAAVQAYDADKAETEQTAKSGRSNLIAKARQVTTDAESKRDAARWEASTLFEASDRSELERHEATRSAIEAEAAGLSEIQAQAEALRIRFKRLWPTSNVAVTGPPTVPAGEGPVAHLRAEVSRADEALTAIEALKSAPAVAGANPVWLFLLPWLLALVPALFAFGIGQGLAAATGGALLIGGGLTAWLTRQARQGLARQVPTLTAAIATANRLVPESRAWSEETHRAQRDAIVARRDSELKRAETSLVARLSEVETRRDQGLRELEHGTRNRLNELQGRRERLFIEAETMRDTQIAQIEAKYAADTQKVQAEHRRLRDEAEAKRQRDWDTLTQRWGGGMSEVGEAVATVDRESQGRFPRWDRTAEGDGALWRPATDVPPALRFGTLTLDLAAVPHGLSKTPELKAMAQERYELPALLTFPDRGSLVIEAAGAGREAANAVLQGAMLRYLTGLPAGKVRFTLLDPVGLGRNFAAFMHLADYSELLVNSRIWTEPQQIEQRLADLSLHMENVIQQFLRNEYATLDEYNRHAGEVAEPYRVLVVADFPANFHETTAQRLMSIATSGARCGVHVLMSVDTERALPTGFSLSDLDAHAVRLKWDHDHFVWKDPAFAPFALTPDVPPPNDRLTGLLHEVGAAAQKANKVEVPFEVVVPPREKWWQGDTRAGIDLPLGRAGATKLQHLQLGKGTAQHVLIAGRTGSGKSSLLHALITNSALTYSPDQVELYLIDFKKGVEFKTYAEHELPHARVIAIESEREFGLSVLQRLDEELKRRGDLFRDLGVQDLNGYRGLAGVGPLPRVLLVVDEFQEFFVEDDKLAQEVALLLDRLVRQGRAFGVHVHLGSQTLSGAYSLARSTLGQMGVRIALQCPEADAHLILSEDNSAARLLTRPGEAIYNDANGLVEGNHLFQVVWLADDRREHYLKEIRALDERSGPHAPRQQIVFEGNVPAELRKNHLLRARLESPDWPDPPKAATAWLGEAVAIKDPTAALFRRMGGNNLLVVGQDGESARGLFQAAILGLAAQYPPGGAQFYVLDGTPEDDAESGRFGSLAGVVPHPYQLGSFRDAGRFLGELAQDLAARQGGATGTPSVFLFVYDHSRFRDLRKSEEDYSFSFGKKGEDAPANPSKQLLDLIKEGPALGIHTVSWFDSLNNLNRSFDRGGLREFEMRVLFQMSANDSSQLIDTPLANRLGPNRALFASEEQGKLEKFRPYGLPSAEWLATAAARFRKRPALDPGPAPES